ncbi:acylphosphatase [Methylomonas sp. AM2-LC]|uniref:acylphosphatase n=1 Tax=Methylomonas sp. AM2-LC TaxID=3153301 RepID=UPI00326599CF
MKISLLIKVQGRVQGVAFRAHTQKQAKQLGVMGYVKNLASGEVEIVAQGNHIEVQQLVTWCRQGPMLAEVKQVLVNDYNEPDIYQDFEIL